MTVWMAVEVIQVAVAVAGLCIGCVLAWSSHVLYRRLAPTLAITNGRLALLAMMARTDVILLLMHASQLYIGMRSFYEQAHGFSLDGLQDLPLARLLTNGALLFAQCQRYWDREIFWPKDPPR